MKLFEKGELKALWPFYLDSLLSPMLFFAPAFIVVYLIGLHLSLFQIGILMALAPLTAFIFEIPTGAFADLYGRKASVLLGYSIEAISVLLIFFTTNFYAIVFAFALMGFGSTFSSGAKEAWIVDLVKNKRKTVHNFFIKSKSFDSFALIVSGFIGAFIVASFGIKTIWLFTFLSFIISITILLFSKEHFTKKKENISGSYKQIKQQASVSVKYGMKHHVIFYLILSGFIITFVVEFAEVLGFAPLLKSFSFPDYAFGYFWSALWAVNALSPYFSKLFFKKGRERNLLIAFTLLSSLMLSLMFFANNYIIAILLLIFSYFFVGMKHPVYKTYFHRFVPSKLRATVGSMENMVSAIAAVIALPLGGFLIDIFGAKMVVVIAGLLGIPIVILYLKIKDGKK